MYSDGFVLLTIPISLLQHGNMTEDEIYRTSTQYRLWSFTPEKLVSLRTSTNALAAERVQTAIKRSREAGQPQQTASADSSGFSSGVEENGQANGDATPEKGAIVDTLTVDEERTLVEYYCSQAKTIGEAKGFKFPPQVIVSCTSGLRSRRAWRADFSTLAGYSNTIHEALLPLQFPNDLPPSPHNDDIAFLSY